MLHGGEEVIIHVGGAAFALEGISELIQRPLMHGLERKQPGDLVPFVDVLSKVVKVGAPNMCGVAVDGFLAAVVDGQLLEVAEDADIELGGPSVAADLKGRVGVGFDVDGRFLSLNEEKRMPARLEGVIRGLGGSVYIHRDLFDHLAEFFGVVLMVVDVPAEGFEEGVEEVIAKLGLVVFAGVVDIALVGKAGDEVNNFLWSTMNGFNLVGH
jgi:hypothetical protein